jgi:hypothetical protein
MVVDEDAYVVEGTVTAKNNLKAIIQAGKARFQS